MSEQVTQVSPQLAEVQHLKARIATLNAEITAALQTLHLQCGYSQPEEFLDAVLRAYAPILSSSPGSDEKWKRNRVDPALRALADTDLKNNMSVREVARKYGVSTSTAFVWKKQLEN